MLKTVQEAATILGVSPDTIRRWEKKGLIKALRSTHNYRLFDVNELQRVYDKYSAQHSSRGFYVLKTEPHRFNVIELFSGAGGLALGFENAGFETRLLVEWDKDAANTLKANRPSWNVLHSDVARVDFQDYADAVDVVAGGFPCQAFSYAGQGRGFEDTRGTLFFEFARCVSQIRPKIALGENVKGLLEHDSGRTLRTMVHILEDLGYKVCFRVLKAQFLDVPQKRERVFIVGVREDIDQSFSFPSERDYTLSLREALEGCPKSAGALYPEKKRRVLEMVPPGGYWRDLPDDVQRDYMGGSYHLTGGKTGMARRLDWDEPSLTLTCSPAQKQTERCHPSETRPLTVREYARLQTFPDDWAFSGSIASQYKQIGNAVPVNLGYHVARAIYDTLSGTSEGAVTKREPTEVPRQLSLWETST